MTAAQRPHRCPFLEWEPEPHPEMRSTVPSAPTQRGRAGAPPPSPRGKPGLGLELWTPVSLSAPGRQTPGRERSCRLGLPPVRERGSREAREGFTPKGPSCAPRALNPKVLAAETLVSAALSWQSCKRLPALLGAEEDAVSSRARAAAPQPARTLGPTRRQRSFHTEAGLESLERFPLPQTHRHQHKANRKKK